MEEQTMVAGIGVQGKIVVGTMQLPHIDIGNMT